MRRAQRLRPAAVAQQLARCRREWLGARRDARWVGVAHSSLGPAWLLLESQRAGIWSGDEATLRCVGEDLKGYLARASAASAGSSRVPDVAIHRGLGAGVVLAARLAASLPAYEPLYRAMLALWRHACATTPHDDYFRGAAGALVACSELAGQGRDVPMSIVDQLRRRVVAAALRSMKAPNPYLGLAHGVAGYLLALEVCAARFARPLTPRFRRALLAFLMKHARRIRGSAGALCWPVRPRDPAVVFHAWCHGAGGIGLVFLTCYRLTGQALYMEAARVALRGLDQCERAPASICCGDAGNVMTLVEAYRVSGNRVWLRRSIRMALERRVYQRLSRARGGQLWQGRTGALYVWMRLHAPHQVGMPGLG